MSFDLFCFRSSFFQFVSFSGRSTWMVHTLVLQFTVSSVQRLWIYGLLSFGTKISNIHHNLHNKVCNSEWIHKLTQLKCWLRQWFTIIYYERLIVSLYCNLKHCHQYMCTGQCIFKHEHVRKEYKKATNEFDEWDAWKKENRLYWFVYFPLFLSVYLDQLIQA